MNFVKDIQDYIINEFNAYGINYALTNDLDNDLLNLFTIQRKIIFPIKREVELSTEIRSFLKSNTKFQPIVEDLKKKLEEPFNVNPHQSKNLFNYHVHDKLIYDWNIYHLHLSEESIPGEYFKSRTKKVLFVYIDNQKALFLDILNHPPHDNFANKRLLEILDNNWNDILMEMNDVVGLAHNPSQQERFKMRKLNINEGGIEINGKFVFPPGLGQATSGHSNEEVNRLLVFKRWMKSNHEEISNHIETANQFFVQTHNLDVPPDYKMVFTVDGPQICDVHSDQCLIKYQENFKAGDKL